MAGGPGLGEMTRKAEGRTCRGLLLSARGGWRDSPQGTGVNCKQVQATKTTLGGTHGIHSGLRLHRCRSPCPPLLTRPPAPTPSLCSKMPLQVSLEPLQTQILSCRFSADEPGKQNNLRRGQRNILEPLFSGFPSHGSARRSLTRTEG